jgi:hypothetical protein
MYVSGEMTIDETLTVQPALQSILLGRRRYAYLLYLGALAFIVFGIGSHTIPMLGFIYGSPLEPIAAIAAIYAFWRGYLWWSRSSLTAGWRRIGASFVSSATFEVATDAFVIDTPDYKVSIPWSGVLLVDPDRRYWLFMVRGVAYCLPKRFFSSPKAELEFLNGVWASLSPAAQARSPQLKSRLSI